MNVSDFNYELPEELIAQDPLEKRDNSRLMVIHRSTGEIEHKRFHDVIQYLNAGDCLVINDTKVIPARLMGVKEETGAAIEVLLLKPASSEQEQEKNLSGKNIIIMLLIGSTCVRMITADYKKIRSLKRGGKK